jgi:H/ACA ribonucleoprotein complex subunit 4
MPASDLPFPERSINELLKFGIINLDKTCGPTSHQVTSWVKKVLEVEKAGHHGTLDPKVTGVLPVALGNSLRIIDLLLDETKIYVGIMRFHSDVKKDQIKDMASQFTGEIYQMPPVRSAVKRQQRVRSIYRLDIIEIEGRDVLFEVECQSGTYIRTLCVDIGDALGVGAHMQELRRTKASIFTEDKSITLHDVKDAWVYWKEDGNEDELRKCILPVEAMVADRPYVIIKNSAVDAICHGADLAAPGISKLDTSLKKGGRIPLFTSKGELVALGKALHDADEMAKKGDGFVVKVDRVVMEPGTYSRQWKTANK